MVTRKAGRTKFFMYEDLQLAIVPALCTDAAAELQSSTVYFLADFMIVNSGKMMFTLKISAKKLCT